MRLSPAQSLRQVKQAIREPYAWPGGYPLYVIMADGECLSIDAARDNWAAICHSTIGQYRDGWQAQGAAINWEDSDMVCCHTGKPIESAYGEG
jgi:hypothetical protein